MQPFHFVLIAIAVVIFFAGIRIIRPTHRGLIERLGKYSKYASPGFHWIIPVIDKMIKVNVTEAMVDAQPQEIITNDNLNATVDAQVYFKVRDDEVSVKASQYNVQDYRYQIVNLARTTLRNIIGTLTLRSANSERGRINTELLAILSQETAHWGMEIVRTELKQIDPPTDVQETMNKVVKAENENLAALDFANAAEREADGTKRSEIKKAEGERQAAILAAQGEQQARVLEAQGIKESKVLKAQGEAEAIRLVNEAAEKYFVGNAQLLRRLEALEKSLVHNTKIVVPNDGELVNVIGDLAGVTPVKMGKNRE